MIHRYEIYIYIKIGSRPPSRKSVGWVVEEMCRRTFFRSSAIGGMGVDHPRILNFQTRSGGGMEWRGGLEPWGPVIRYDLVSAGFFLIFGQISALRIDLLDRFATLASSFRFRFVPGWCSPGWVDSEERALLWTVESFL